MEQKCRHNSDAARYNERNVNVVAVVLVVVVVVVCFCCISKRLSNVVILHAGRLRVLLGWHVCKRRRITLNSKH